MNRLGMSRSSFYMITLTVFYSLEANTQTIFILKVLEWRLKKVNCTEKKIVGTIETVCKQMINIK